jgi:hypothetical protein
MPCGAVSVAQVLKLRPTVFFNQFCGNGRDSPFGLHSCVIKVTDALYDREPSVRVACGRATTSFNSKTAQQFGRISPYPPPQIHALIAPIDTGKIGELNASVPRDDRRWH